MELIIGFICHTIVVYLIPTRLWQNKYVEKLVYSLLPYAGNWAYRK
jgi:hypothetical protein